MAGGVLKGFGVFFIVLGSLAIVLGLVTAAFGAYMANEEDNRGFFADRDKAEGGIIVGLGGMALAGMGLVLLLLGILLYAIGAGQARRELMHAVARQTPVPAPIPIDTLVPPPGAPFRLDPGVRAREPVPAVAPPSTPRPLRPTEGSSTEWRIVGFVGALALGVLLLLLLFRPGGPAADLHGQDMSSSVQVATFDGTFRDARTPLGTRLTSDPQHELHLARDGTVTVRASLNWTTTPVPQSLVLLLEAQDGEDGEWTTLGQAEGPSGLTIESGPTALRNLVRARISFPENAGGTADYVLTLTVIGS